MISRRTTEILTGLLFTIAQLPNGTHAQRWAFAASRRWSGHSARARRRSGGSSAPRPRSRIAWPRPDLHRDRCSAGWTGWTPQQAQTAAYETAMASETERRRRTGAPGGGEVARRALGQVVRPRDPHHAAVAAFEQVVMQPRLGS